MEWNSQNNGDKMLCQENKLAVIIAIGLCLVIATIFGGVWLLCKHADEHKVNMSNLGFTYTSVYERDKKDITWKSSTWMKGDGAPIVIDIVPNTEPRRITVEEATKFLREELKK